MGIHRISTGTQYLDEVTHGGFPLGSVIMYSGGPGSPKFLSGLNFISIGLKNQENVLIVTTKYPIPKIMQIAEYYNINHINAIFIDAANWRIKRLDRSSKSPSNYEVNNITDLNSLLSLIIQACTENKKITRIFFDSPSSL